MWYNRDGVILFPEDGDREDALVLTLKPSPPMREIASWSPIAGQAFDQASLLRLLRIRFKGYLPDAAAIIEAIRNVRWTQNEVKETVQLKGKASLGKSISKEIYGFDNLPDFITFEVPVFESGFFFVTRIECALEPDESNGMFRLTPVSDAVEQAWKRAESQLGETLNTAMPSELPVYYGHPGA